MATANLSGLKNNEGVDLIDAIVAPLFVAATLSMSGLGTIGLDNPITFYLSDVLYSASGPRLPGRSCSRWPRSVSRGSRTRRGTFDDFSQEQAGIVATMVLLNVFSAIVPAVASALETYWYVGVLLLFVNGAGYYLIAYY